MEKKGKMEEKVWIESGENFFEQGMSGWWYLIEE